MTGLFGPLLLGPDRTRFRLWAPKVGRVSLVVEGMPPVPMTAGADGWHAVECACGPGARYRFQVSPDLLVPDPGSRAQAGDVHDASIVVDAHAYRWQHPDWRGRPWHEAVIYELHVGALGGFNGVAQWLPHLAALGVTAIELMPIADFPGPRNWGYDGVLPYAPDAAYGTPDELKRLVDAAHGLGLMVMLDVVYNHFGPDGNYLSGYAPGLYRGDRHTPWGDAIDFRREPVRRYFIENALYWVQEFRIDGLRFDAVHAIDDSEYLMALAVEVRAAAGPHRHVHLVLENEHNDAGLLRETPDAPGYDAQWADDLHHCIHVLLTGEDEGYYAHFQQAPAEQLARCLAEGFAFQGETRHDGRARGTPSAHLPPTAFVVCLQNHDQVGNRAMGDRLTVLADPDGLRAATVLLLLAPQIPLLFMGQEWASRTPFLYFASHTGELADAVLAGRRREFAAFEHFNDPVKQEAIPDPNAEATFTSSIPDRAEIERDQHARWLELHRLLLHLRAAEIAPRIPGAAAGAAKALGRTGVFAQWRMGDGALLSMALNLGADPVKAPAMPGRVLFETTPGSPDRNLPPRSALVRLMEAAA
jgi:maltooligosyltrehalose trehalohydrolase